MDDHTEQLSYDDLRKERDLWRDLAQARGTVNAALRAGGFGRASGKTTAIDDARHATNALKALGYDKP